MNIIKRNASQAETSVSKKKKETTDSQKKDEKIPNSLIIYIKTRIPNFYKLNYQPYMSVPKNESQIVYFEPLIKYYEGPIKNIPTGAPKDSVLTQFFEASEFDSMINRILSDLRYMQKPRTLKEAYEQRIIDNNIKLTLKTLFKPNSLFYINKKPYTIVGIKSNPSDWQIDQKPLEQLLTQYPNLTLKQVQEEAKKEEDDIPEVLKQSNIASANMSNEENLSIVASGLQNAIDSNTKTNKEIEKEITGVTDAFISQDNLYGVSKSIRKLYSEYLRKNIPINYSYDQDISRDPLTISLLINPADLLNFINSHKKTNLIDLYKAFSNSKIILESTDKSYIDACTELAIYKTTFDKKIEHIRDEIIEKTKNNTLDTKIQNSLVQIITTLKIDYMKIIFKIADTIMEIYRLQHIYFVSTKELLQGLKEDYVNIIKYYEKPELALKCMDNDIYTLSLLITEDSNNHYSESYYKNYNTFKEFYNNKLYKNQQDLLQPQINYSDEAKIYMKQPDVLLIEKKQYEIYNFKMFLFYSYNQFDIWVVIFKSIQLFIDFIGRETTDIIGNSEVLLTKLNNQYTLKEQTDLLNKINAKGIKATFDKDTKSLKWYLVKEDGTRALELIKKNLSEERFEKMYLEYTKSSVKAYDAIILYIYLLEILCLRQNRVYVAEENVNKLNLEYSLTLYQYYKTITDNLRINSQVYIPQSILWDTNKLNDPVYIQQRQKTNDKASIIYRGRIKLIAESRDNLVTSCEEISSIINPNISKQGFIQKCNTIITENISNITPHSFKSSYWISKTITNYDIEDTNDFIYNMNRIVKDAWYDRVIDDIYPKDYLDWMVINNNTNNIEDSLYAAVADGLNRQLEITDNETTNPYTEEIEGKLVFTVFSLKKLVKETNEHRENPIDLTNFRNIIWFLQNTLKIKFIIFEMLPRDGNKINVGDMVLYKKNQNRVIMINNGVDGILYNLYNGYTKIDNVPSDMVELYDENILNDFRLFCQYDYYEESEEYNDYMYLVITNKKNEDTSKNTYSFKLVQETNKGYIFTLKDIPIYISYFIFNSCSDVSLGVDTIRKMGLKELETQLLNFKEQRIQRIAKHNIEGDILNIQQSIDKYKKQYYPLKKMKNKNLEQQAEELLLREEINDLKARINILKKLQQGDEMTVRTNPIGKNNILGSGGAVRLKPSEQYTQYNPIGYPLNPNIPSNIVYLPRQNNVTTQYNNKYRLPYNVLQNKAEDKKSKLSFYITIELELFPGTSANILQKNAVKCQNTFERIREAWANIFGFQYSPAPKSDAYTYNKTEKKKVIEKNKTRKNKSLTFGSK